jgi:uncharacterized membrane protein YraQ (UPF0718 family)
MSASRRKYSAAGGWLFLGLVVIVYVLFAIVNPASTIEALRFFARVMQKVYPALGLVFVLLFVAHLLLRPAWIKRYLGRESGLRGWLTAVVAGVLSLGPVYTWYALLGELRGKGVRPGLMGAFLYGRAIKLPLLPVMIHYFGLGYTLVLSAYLLLFSVINGLVLERLLLRQPAR